MVEDILYKIGVSCIIIFTVVLYTSLMILTVGFFGLLIYGIFMG